MSAGPETDARGVLLECRACGTVNRVAWEKSGSQGRCGNCGAALPVCAEPVNVGSAADFEAMLSRSALPVVVDFWAPWCGPCRMAAPEFARAAASAAGEALFVKVNTDELPEAAARFRVRGIPAFAVVKHGRVLGETSGAQPAAQLLSWVRGLLAPGGH